MPRPTPNKDERARIIGRYLALRRQGARWDYAARRVGYSYATLARWMDEFDAHKATSEK